MDKGFIFNDYIADIELDGNNIYTNWLGPNKVLRFENIEVPDNKTKDVSKLDNPEPGDAIINNGNGYIKFGVDIPKGSTNIYLKEITFSIKPD
jgi:hypothetical protein